MSDHDKVNIALSNKPPQGLVTAQRMAIESAEKIVHETMPGETEKGVLSRLENCARAKGAVGFWTPTVVGFGPGSLSCFPTDKPSDRPLWNIDIGHVDVHPVTEEGWGGDCTRTIVVGKHPRHHEILSTLSRIHHEVLSSLEPEMRACDAFQLFERKLKTTPYRLLDRLENIGHSLSQGGSYEDGYLNRWNKSVLKGAWAFEPFIGTDLYGAKIEDVMWFGPSSCVWVK